MSIVAALRGFPRLGAHLSRCSQAAWKVLLSNKIIADDPSLSGKVDTSGGEIWLEAVVQRPVHGSFFGNSGEVVRLMALGGAGLARLARFHVDEDLAAGRLVPVLEEFSPGDAEDIHAVYAGPERLSSRIRCFVDFLAVHAAVRG